MELASNTVALLGLVEAILRAGSKAYDFIAAVQDAPQEVRDLQHELNGVNLLLSELKDYWNDLSSVQTWSRPSLLMDSCISSLRNIHQDLDVLATAAQKHDSSKKVASTWAKIKWTFGNKQVEKLTRCLERHKLSLVAALAVDGKRMQLHYQQELKQSVLQSSEQILSSIVSGSVRCHQDIRNLQMLSLSNQTSLELESPKIVCTASDSGFPSVRNNYRGPTISRRKVPACSGTHSRKLDVLHADVKHLSIMLSRFNAIPSSTYHAPSFGSNREEILLSLLLLRPQINFAIGSLLAEQPPELSGLQLDWLGSEFSLLLTAVMQNNDDVVTYDRNVPSATFTNPVYHISSFYGGRHFTKPASKCTARHRSKLGHKGMVIRIWRFESTVGRLDIRRTTTSSDQGIDRYEDLGFTFIPFLDMPATAVCANFPKNLSGTRPLQIQRQLHTYTILPYRECRGLYKLFETGTLHEIDDAFRHGKASPYVLDFVGRSIHYPAARAGRLDVLQYLADQGLGPATVDAGSHALRGLCELWRSQAYNPVRGQKRRDDIFRWLIDNGCDVNYSVPLSEGPVQYTVTMSAKFICYESISLFQHWITMLRQEGYDLETRNFAGETALLTHAGNSGTYSFEAIQWLLRSGADPKATNPKGFNSLICAILSTTNGERHRSTIRSKLRCLIAGGCEVNQCDSSGLTPSQHAVQNSCWYEWCYALEYNGFNIQEVIDASRAQQKRASLESFRRCYKNDILIDNTSPSVRLQMLRSKTSLAVDSYNKWKRTHFAVFVYFLTSVKAVQANTNFDYKPLLDFCNNSNVSVAHDLTMEMYNAIYDNITELLFRRKDLFDVLYALNRALPNMWDNQVFCSARGHPRMAERIDEAITILRNAQVFYYRFYMTTE
ncbi:hypothetical protein MMC18_005548 [Xylographa bjoerkii]|nr:hypothetical protein [Xylographa bjoerkii]